MRINGIKYDWHIMLFNYYNGMLIQSMTNINKLIIIVRNKAIHIVHNNAIFFPKKIIIFYDNVYFLRIFSVTNQYLIVFNIKTNYYWALSAYKIIGELTIMIYWINKLYDWYTIQQT